VNKEGESNLSPSPICGGGYQKTENKLMPCYAYQGIRPVVDPTSYLHPLACLIGDVIIGPGCFIAPGASLRADFGRIVVEGDSSIQDSVTIHSNALGDTIIKRGCTIGHGAVIHGCVIGENTLVGILSIMPGKPDRRRFAGQIQYRHPSTQHAQWTPGARGAHFRGR